MKKWRKTCIKIAGLTAAGCMLFSGCSPKETQYEVSNYQGMLTEGETTSDYNKELFYRNEKQTSGADPFVLDNTERDGYYYLYGTEGSLYCYRSKNLMDWEPVGNALDNMKYAEDGSITEARRVANKDIWAPEVVYDEDMELYYMFFSATPKPDTSVEGAIAGDAEYIIMVATSAYPYKDFQLVDFTDPSSCGAENVRDYDKNAYPQYYAKYALLDPAPLLAYASVEKEYYDRGGFIPNIDPHPFVDENGEKYLFWADQQGINRIFALKMTNWLTPDWSTMTTVIWANYYNGEDYEASKTDQSVPTVPFENTTLGCNEGPAVVYHNGKYYLTYSVNSYKDNSYEVAQAVSDNVLGPYRKLTEEEGTIMLSGSVAGSQEVSGTGHHSFVTVGEKLYIVYHRHNDAVAAGDPRHAVIDEVKWITIKDIEGNDLDVMYTNGPTDTVQPRIEEYSEYRNIAGEAAVTVSEDAKVENTACLTDGLLSIYKYANENFMQYVKETSISETTTFTFDFDEAKVVRAIMVYNSKMEDTIFRNISRIELVCEEDGQEVTRFMKNLKFSSEYYKSNDFDGSIYYVTPGAAAYAEFDELNVKSIRITIEVPEGQESVGISEVRILGK